MLIRKSTDDFRPKRISDVAQTKVYRPQFQKATLSNMVLHADGSVTEAVSKSPAVANATLNPYARENYVRLRATGINDANLEAVITAFMVGRNFSISNEIVGGSADSDGVIKFDRATVLQFSMLGLLNQTITDDRSGLVQSSTVAIDSGRVFDIVQLPYSIKDSLALVAVPENTNDSLVLKDLKDSIKIIWSFMRDKDNYVYNLFFGRCKTTLSDAYTPFGDLPAESRVFYVDEESTINLNS